MQLFITHILLLKIVKIICMTLRAFLCHSSHTDLQYKLMYLEDECQIEMNMALIVYISRQIYDLQGVNYKTA